MAEYVTTSVHETHALAIAFAHRLHRGDSVYFTGGLGAGKTAFCIGLAEGLCCIDIATSPTFAIVNLYRGPQPLAHFDLYRITSEDDLDATGFYDYLEQGAVVAVEWSENLRNFLPPPTYEISFTVIDENARKITITEMTF